MKILVYQFQWPGDMVTIGNNDPWIVFHDRYHNRPGIDQGIYLSPVHNYPDLQEAEQHLVFPGND